jgi:hypothetical protein
MQKKHIKIGLKSLETWIAGDILVVFFLASLLFPSFIPRSEFLFTLRSSIFILLFGIIPILQFYGTLFEGKDSRKIFN